LDQVRRVVAYRRPIGAGAGDGEGQGEREPNLDGGIRLARAAELRERGSQRKMHKREISVGLDCPLKPRDRLVPGAELVLRIARETLPGIGIRIARTEAKGLTDVSLCFFGATNESLAKSDKAWELARFRSSANACSSSAMPSAARLVHILTKPSN